MNIKKFIYIYSIFSIFAVSLGLFIIYEENEIPKINNLIEISDNLNYESIILIGTIADNHLEFLEFIVNPNIYTFNRYTQTEKLLETEIKIIEKRLQTLESLKKHDHINLQHEHTNDELKEIKESLNILKKHKTEIISSIKKIEEIKTNSTFKDQELNIETIKKRQFQIEKIDNAYDKIELNKQVLTFLDNHKIIYENLLIKKETVRKRHNYEITLLITLFTLLSFTSIYKFRNILIRENKNSKN